MRKKDKLYTVSKWNQPLFMPKENLFGAGSQMFKPQDAGILGNVPSQTELNNKIRGIQPSGINWNQPITSSIPSQGYQISSDRVPQQSAPISQSNQGGFNWGNVGKGAATAASFIPANEMTIGDRTFKRGLWDAGDPIYYATEGRESKLGNTFSDAGVSLAKTGIPIAMFAGAIAKSAGSTINAATGTKTDAPAETAIKDQNNYLANYTSNAGSYDGLVRANPVVNYQDVYKGPSKAVGNTTAIANAVLGGFTPEALLISHFLRKGNSKARKEVAEKNAALKQEYDNAIAWADNSYLNNLHNIQREQINNALRNYSAFGGPIDVMQQDNDMSAINYGFMADYLNAKRQIFAKQT